jgi:glycosyltransferase involved in cell wall biosynthesis
MTRGQDGNDGSIDPARLYDEAYYQTHLGAIPYSREQPALVNHFRTAAVTLVERYQPKRVLDVGCAKGLLVEQLRDQGVEAFGVDGSPYAISQVRDDLKSFCRVGSALEPIEGRYDLITCIEVAEHLSEPDAEKLVANLCSATDTVVFSSTPEDYAEPTHFNVQPREYWVELFARQGFYPDLRFEPSFLTPQAMRFQRMTRPLRVVIFSKERAEWAVVRLRILDPLRELENQGRMKVTFVSATDEQLPVEELMAADVFVIQREFADRSTSTEIVEAAKLLGKVIVFEIDDLLTHVPRSNPVYPYSTRIAQDLIDAVKAADFVTASTQPLLDELTAEVPDVPTKGHVLRNCVNTEIWGSQFTPRPRREGEPLVVGWFGSPTHQEDLAIVRDALSYLGRKYAGKVEFAFFGYFPAEFEGIEGAYLARGGIADVVKHAKGVREAQIDIAIAPLTDHPFNRSKSDLKWLEYSICSIPGVYSRVAPYENSIVHGFTGWLVDNTTASWVDALERLIENDRLRDSIARNAFEEVRGNYCLDVAASAWDDLYRAFTVSGAREIRGEDREQAAIEAAALLFKAQAKRQSQRGTVLSAVASFEASLSLSGAATDDALNAGLNLTKRGRLAAAERMLLATATRNPDSAEPWVWLTRFYRFVDDPVRAEWALEGGRKADETDLDLALLHVHHLRETHREAGIAERLAPVTAAEIEPTETVAAAEALVRAGRPGDALTIVRQTASRHPDVDFAPLTMALSKASAVAPDSIGEWTPARHRKIGDALKVAVYAAEPLAAARVVTSLRSPLRVLERACLVSAQWSDGESNAGIASWSDVVVLHRSFLASPHGERVIARAKQGGKPVVLVIEDMLFPHAEEHVALFAADCDAIVVPTERLAAMIGRYAPAIAERIHVLPPTLDAEILGGKKFENNEGRPLAVGLFTSHARPNDMRELAAALGRYVESSRGQVTLTTWAPTYDGKPSLATSRSVGAATPFYLEYARRLTEKPLDVALVPVSNDERYEALSDQVALELAAARVPLIATGRDPFASSVVAGSTGFLLGDDPTAWIEGIQQLRENPRLRRDVADRAWTIAFAERTTQACASRLGEILAAAVRDGARERQAVAAPAMA